MWEIKIALSLMGLSAFILPVFFLYGRGGDGVKDPAIEEIEQRQSDQES